MALFGDFQIGKFLILLSDKTILRRFLENGNFEIGPFHASTPSYMLRNLLESATALFLPINVIQFNLADRKVPGVV